MDIKKRILRVLSNLVILIFLMIFFRSQFDQSSSLVRRAYAPLNPIQSFFSLYQSWQMFAPNPSRINSFVSGEVEFDNGETTQYSFYRPGRDELMKRYLFGERFRKFFSEGVRLDKNSRLWPDVVNFIKEDVEAQNKNRKVKKISLKRHWNTIPNWNETFINFTQPIPIPYEEYLFYTKEF